ncbi:MAG: hypothetical protein WAW17_02590 [Rhodococcus sp. (in: high G+C Gram-positive bacteria)]|uniref:hypothetical protein n=1 Tax=Rhodococcus sp. TaxID=1831 RepID=UPI003BB1B529
MTEKRPSPTGRTAINDDTAPRFAEDYRHATPFAVLLERAPKDTLSWRKNAERIEKARRQERERAEKDRARADTPKRPGKLKGEPETRREVDERRRAQAREWIWDLLTDPNGWYLRMYADEDDGADTASGNGAAVMERAA